MTSFPAQSTTGIQAMLWSATVADSSAGHGTKLTPQEVDRRVQRWLKLCALDTPDSALPLVVAAATDARSSSKLLKMLGEPADKFRDWWHLQDPSDYRMTEATGSTDWALLALARVSFDARHSSFAALTD